MTPATEQQREWLFLRAAILVVSVLLALELVGTVADTGLNNPSPSALALTTKCLRNEKSLAVETGAVDQIGKTADGGVARTRIEGNRVTVVISASDKKAERIADYYDAVNGGPEDAIELRGHVVYVWQFSPSPTQRQP